MLLKIKEVDWERTQIRTQFLVERSQFENSGKWQVASDEQETGDRSQDLGFRI